MNTNDLLSNQQFGFRPHRSTVTAVSNFTDEVLLNMEKGKLCGAAFKDLAKAFDTIDHRILLSKMLKLGISSNALNWFESYLSNRKQRVSVDHELSDELPVSYGVPQGSILGPLLFNIYIDKLPSILNHTQISLYADDTVIYCYHTHLSDIERNLNEDLLKVAHWLNENKLTLNLDKTKCMIIGSSYRLARIGCLSVRILDHKLESVSNFKYLGVFIFEDLTWNHHVEYLTTKINQRLGLLKRIKHLLPFEARMLFYNGLVLPLFDYADIVWGDKNNSTLMNNIQILQNKAAKIILDRPIQSSSSEALTAMKWITLEKRRLYHRCLYVYKCVNGYIDHPMELLTQGEICSYNRGVGTGGAGWAKAPSLLSLGGQCPPTLHVPLLFTYA